MIISQYGKFISFNTIPCLKLHPKGETGDIYTDRHTPGNPISVSSTGIYRHFGKYCLWLGHIHAFIIDS